MWIIVIVFFPKMKQWWECSFEDLIVFLSFLIGKH